ncbi:hypothetical protein KIPB_012474, partial [Kipferlia bialata]
ALYWEQRLTEFLTTDMGWPLDGIWLDQNEPRTKQKGREDWDEGSHYVGNYEPLDNVMEYAK